MHEIMHKLQDQKHLETKRFQLNERQARSLEVRMRGYGVRRISSIEVSSRPAVRACRILIVRHHDLRIKRGIRFDETDLDISPRTQQIPLEY